MSKEISLQELFTLDQDELSEIFLNNGGAITVVPPKYYSIDWNKIKTTEDIIIILKYLMNKFYPDNKIMIGALDQDSNKTNIMPYLTLIK